MSNGKESEETNSIELPQQHQNIGEDTSQSILQTLPQLFVTTTATTNNILTASSYVQ